MSAIVHNIEPPKDYIDHIKSYNEDELDGQDHTKQVLKIPAVQTLCHKH